LMEDRQEEEDHLIEDHYLIYLLDFYTYGWHMIQECSCHHGTHWL
jgi:hypothetical protein